MAMVQLSSKEAAQLEEILRSSEDPRQLKRSQALLWLAEGDSIDDAADRLRVSLQTVYNWISRFNQRSDQSLELRVADGHRSGRPCTALGIIDPLIEQIIDTDPRELGYRSTIWTAELLQRYLKQQHHISISTKSVNRAITRLEISWKRPRHQLALRDPHWRQAKGG